MSERFKLYKHLMNGFSYMLPFVVAGGLLIAISMFGLLDGLFPYINDVGVLILSYTYPVLAGFIAFSIADRPGIVVGVAAGALALAGDSGFIGAIIGGFLAGYLMELLKLIFKRLPKSLSGIKPILIFPFFGALFISLIMLGVNYVISPLSLWLEQTIVTLEGLPLLVVAMLLGGLMAVDLGGPINKISYMIGVISIVHGHDSIIMAAIMVAGMTPPLALAFDVFVFKKDFTELDIKLGKTNIATGLSFISEGAIPFVRTYKQKVHIPLIIGSILAAMIVAIFQTSVPAPHGGIFVIFLMSNWWGFLIALVSGTMLSALLIKMLFILGAPHERN